MATICKGKNSWPELVGKNGDEAAEIIKRENPNIVDAIVILEGTAVIENFRCDRVWVRVNECRIVTEVPTIG
ncbi:proteinase inhibitor [Carica papaya]|uniref:proteinase inhibitor n=1 Tax=Carica papaya TaxID=3649 RepID=UPI000B8D00F4|nr:proteinase inhibitor [Carica papaya]